MPVTSDTSVLTSHLSQIEDYSGSIIKETLEAKPEKREIREDATAINEHAAQAVKLVETLQNQSGIIESLEDKVKDLEEERKQATLKIWVMLSYLSGLGVSLGILITCFKFLKQGIPLTMANLILGCCCYAMQTWAWLFGIVIVILILITVFYIACYGWRNRKYFLDTVFSFDKVKKETEWTDKQKLAVTKMQSDATRKAVKAVKAVKG